MNAGLLGDACGFQASHQASIADVILLHVGSRAL